MYFNNKDVSIYYEKSGNNKKNILILPGWGNTRTTFTNIINFFKDNYTIYIIDYPGFGNSPIPEKELTIYDYTNLVRDFLDEMQIKNPIIIAHSFGGRIATLLTGYYKEKIDKIIMIAHIHNGKCRLLHLHRHFLYSSIIYSIYNKNGSKENNNENQNFT